jgi:Protein of unknown function (DUF2934)
MFSTRWIVYKKRNRHDKDGCCASDEPEIRWIAYQLWEQAGKPDGMSDFFWQQAKKQVGEPRRPPERETNYVCSRCGSGAYFDGRCGDGPILMCGCGGYASPVPASSYSYNPYD